MRIAVFGAGGIGGYFGARLAQAGNDVALVARGAHLQAIQANGLFVKSSTGDFHITPFIATNSPAEVGVVDLVILGIKAWDVREASEQIRPMIGPDTGVLTLQNGVEAPTEVADELGDDHVIVGVSPVPGKLIPKSAFLLSPGPFTIHPITASFKDSTPLYFFFQALINHKLLS